MKRLTSHLEETRHGGQGNVPRPRVPKGAGLKLRTPKVRKVRFTGPKKEIRPRIIMPRRERGRSPARAQIAKSGLSGERARPIAARDNGASKVFVQAPQTQQTRPEPSQTASNQEPIRTREIER